MTQLTFQNIRNLGANSNQPLITNQNDFQIFDNVTWIKGRHTLKAGGSLTLRSREILNADTIVGNFNFNNNMTSNCAGQGAGCTVDSATGFDVASFLLGLVNTEEPQPVRRRHLHGEAAGDTRSTCRTTSAREQADAQSRPALGRLSALGRNRGPAVELRRDDRQVRRRVRQRDDRRRRRSAAICRPTRRRHRSAARLRVRRLRRRQDAGPRRLRHVLELLARRHVLVEGAEPAVPAVDGAERRPRPPTASTCCSRTACRILRASIPARPPAGATRSIFDVNFRDAYARQWNVNVQRGLGKNYMVEAAYVGSQGRQMVLKVDINQAPPVVGVSDSNVNRPFITLAPAVRGLSQSQSIGKVDYNGLLLKFQRRFANNFSFLNSYTYGQSIDFASDNEAGHHQHLRPRLQPRAVRLRRQAHVLVELDLRVAAGPQQASTAAGS